MADNSFIPPGALFIGELTLECSGFKFTALPKTEQDILLEYAADALKDVKFSGTFDHCSDAMDYLLQVVRPANAPIIVDVRALPALLEQHFGNTSP